MTTPITRDEKLENGVKRNVSTTTFLVSPIIMLLGAALALALSVWHKDSILTFAIASGSHSDIVDTGYAKYQGNRTYHNTIAYLGIPYAEPPIGNLRFRAPLPLNTTRVRSESAGKIVDAKQYPEFCVQGATGGGDAGGAGSEDCLKVNIYAPAGATKRSKRKVPVLFYIHGGGYIYGNPRNWPFDHWVHQSPNVVIVSVYYRLSSLGFLAHPELQDAKNGDLNAGFLDQIEALRWVKRNIGSFGGDPTKVTINGESAGGASVELHLVAEEGQRLFRGAIAQSVYRTPLPSPEQQVPLFRYYAETAGCGTGFVAEQLACLRKAPVSALAKAQDTAGPPNFTASGYNTFHPVVDGKVITDYPTRLISQGKFARVPLIVGYVCGVRFLAASFGLSYAYATASATTNETLSGGPDIGAALRQFFPSITDENISELEEAALSQHGGKTWVYRYNQKNPTNPSPSVTHAAENWMMFLGTNTGVNGTTTFSDMSPVETDFASELIAYWLSFVRKGNPNAHKLSRSPEWPSYRTTRRNRIVLQQVLEGESKKSGSFLEVESKEETERCGVVAGQVKTQQN
ncbi:hypothetical protein NMY22_g12789 [Coprinellus aureogranulatus]|nr:hypothetical protein NMY22_g12789 [Coprinellus aureogranulatus]